MKEVEYSIYGSPFALPFYSTTHITTPDRYNQAKYSYTINPRYLVTLEIQTQEAFQIIDNTILTTLTRIPTSYHHKKAKTNTASPLTTLAKNLRSDPIPFKPFAN